MNGTTHNKCKRHQMLTWWDGESEIVPPVSEEECVICQQYKIEIERRRAENEAADFNFIMAMKGIDRPKEWKDELTSIPMRARQ